MVLKQKPGPRKGSASICYQATTPTAHEEVKSFLCPQTRKRTASSFLATTGAIEQDLELSNSDQGAAQAVAAGLRDAKAANTRRAYASAWHTFCDWTILTRRQAMPAAPQDVAFYLGHLAAAGKTIATINQARAAISHAHAAAGIAKANNPARHPVVAEGLAQCGASAQTGGRTHRTSPGPDPGDCPASQARTRGTHGVRRGGTGPGRHRPGHRRWHVRRRAEKIRGLGFDLGRR